MAEFTLPANSKIGAGETYKGPGGAKNIKTFKIYRWTPDDGKNPSIDTYEVDMFCLPIASNCWNGLKPKAFCR